MVVGAPIESWLALTKPRKETKNPANTIIADLVFLCKIFLTPIYTIKKLKCF
jgi:hypothetical protein